MSSGSIEPMIGWLTSVSFSLMMCCGSLNSSLRIASNADCHRTVASISVVSEATATRRRFRSENLRSPAAPLSLPAAAPAVASVAAPAPAVLAAVEEASALAAAAGCPAVSTLTSFTS